MNLYEIHVSHQPADVKWRTSRTQFVIAGTLERACELAKAGLEAARVSQAIRRNRIETPVIIDQGETK